MSFGGNNGPSYGGQPGYQQQQYGGQGSSQGGGGGYAPNGGYAQSGAPPAQYGGGMTQQYPAGGTGPAGGNGPQYPGPGNAGLQGGDARARFDQLCVDRELRPDVADDLYGVLTTSRVVLLLDDSGSMRSRIVDPGASPFQAAGAPVVTRWSELEKVSFALALRSVDSELALRSVDSEYTEPRDAARS